MNVVRPRNERDRTGCVDEIRPNPPRTSPSPTSACTCACRVHTCCNLVAPSIVASSLLRPAAVHASLTRLMAGTCRCCALMSTTRLCRLACPFLPLPSVRLLRRESPSYNRRTGLPLGIDRIDKSGHRNDVSCLIEPFRELSN